MKKPFILIPAYKPDREILSNLIKELSALDVAGIMVVNDGSGPEYDRVFEHLASAHDIRFLSHKTNQGKGAALRTGFRHITKMNIPCSHVVTVDADGQHLPGDVKQVIIKAREHSDALVLGVREFKGRVPLRSSLGNKATYLLFRGLVGQKVSDTQTGLRAIPASLLERLILLSSDRYAYELDMLLTLIQDRVTVQEVPIETVYEDNNSSSSFRPVKDSILIYKALFLWWFSFRFKQMIKYSLAGIFSTIADFGTYILLINLSCGFVTASILARGLSVLIHFFANRYFTFSIHRVPNLKEIAKYLMVVAFNLGASIFLIFLFVNYLSMGEVVAKVLAQTLLFFSTYTLLNGFVFFKDKEPVIVSRV